MRASSGIYLRVPEVSGDVVCAVAKLDGHNFMHS